MTMTMTMTMTTMTSTTPSKTRFGYSTQDGRNGPHKLQIPGAQTPPGSTGLSQRQNSTTNRRPVCGSQVEPPVGAKMLSRPSARNRCAAPTRFVTISSGIRRTAGAAGTSLSGFFWISTPSLLREELQSKSRQDPQRGGTKSCGCCSEPAIS